MGILCLSYTANFIFLTYKINHRSICFISARNLHRLPVFSHICCVEKDASTWARARFAQIVRWREPRLRATFRHRQDHQYHLAWPASQFSPSVMRFARTAMIKGHHWASHRLCLDATRPNGSGMVDGINTSASISALAYHLFPPRYAADHPALF